MLLLIANNCVLWCKCGAKILYLHHKTIEAWQRLPHSFVLPRKKPIRRISGSAYGMGEIVTRALRRFELHRRITADYSFVLSLDEITPILLQDIEEFLRNEYMFAEKYPSIYEVVPESRTPQPRGQNRRV